MKKNLVIAGQTISPGTRRILQLKLAALYDYTEMVVPLEVIRGRADGPVLFVCAAIHGDEINGVEIVKRLLRKKVLAQLKGTLIAVPIVNVFGFNARSRYLPDRRDLNRCFPGKKDGSLSSRLAFLFMKEVVSKCTHGIDLHTGAIHRDNLPQIRAFLDDPETEQMARSFRVPVVAAVRDGSLREATRRRKISTLLFEGGEALRFQEDVVNTGVRGCLSVMRYLKMIPERKTGASNAKSFISRGSSWVRAPHSGAFSLVKKLGDHVETGEVLAVISDPFGRNPYDVKAVAPGIIVGISTIPLVNRGDAMFHVATFQNSRRVKRVIDLFEELV